MMKVIKQKVDRNSYELSKNNYLVNDQSIETSFVSLRETEGYLSFPLLHTRSSLPDYSLIGILAMTEKREQAAGMQKRKG